MIAYDYRCTACEYTWEADQRIIDPALTLCPCCGKETAQRLVGGGGGFRLQGEGWASDGYAARNPAGRRR